MSDINTEAEWRQQARALLRTQMMLTDMRYKALARALETLGVSETPKVLANKVNRGAFSLAFFLQCMQVMGLELRVANRPTDRPLPTSPVRKAGNHP